MSWPSFAAENGSCRRQYTEPASISLHPSGVVSGGASNPDAARRASGTLMLMADLDRLVKDLASLTPEELQELSALKVEGDAAWPTPVGGVIPLKDRRERSRPGKVHDVEKKKQELIEDLAKQMRLAFVTAGANSIDAKEHIALSAYYKALGLNPPEEKISAEADSLPKVAPELYASRANRKENPVEFIKRVYAPWLGRGLDRPTILRLDKQLYHGLTQWRLKHGPDDLDLPKKSDVVTREIDQAGPDGIREARRLARAASNRPK